MRRRPRAATPSPQPIMPITVAETADRRPAFRDLLGEELWVNFIDQWWQVDAEVWEHKPVNRIHYRVTLEDGRSLEVFKNMDHGGWYVLSKQRSSNVAKKQFEDSSKSMSDILALAGALLLGLEVIEGMVAITIFLYVPFWSFSRFIQKRIEAIEARGFAKVWLLRSIRIFVIFPISVIAGLVSLPAAFILVFSFAALGFTALLSIRQQQW